MAISGSGIPAGAQLEDTITAATGDRHQWLQLDHQRGRHRRSVRGRLDGRPAPASPRARRSRRSTATTRRSRPTRPRAATTARALTGPAVWTLSQAATATGDGRHADRRAASSRSAVASTWRPASTSTSRSLSRLMYEANRAQFEANIDHSTNYPNPSTGTDFWLLNHAIPTLLWGIYNTDYDTERRLLRGQEGQRDAARAVRLRQQRGRRQQHGDARQPQRRRRRRACRSSRRSTTSPAQVTRRPDRQRASRSPARASSTP